MKLRLLITGGSGYIGSNFIKYYGKKYSLFVIDKNPIKKKSRNLKRFYNFNINNQNKFSEIIKQNKIDGNIHLAAKIVAQEYIRGKKMSFETNY